MSEVLLANELQMESPASPLLRSLFNAAGIFVEARTEAILGFLDALMELSEEKALVAEALEKGTLPLLKEQVESTLEQNWGELPRDVGCDPEAQILHAVYVCLPPSCCSCVRSLPLCLPVCQLFNHSPQTSGCALPSPSSPHPLPPRSPE